MNCYLKTSSGTYDALSWIHVCFHLVLVSIAAIFQHNEKGMYWSDAATTPEGQQVCCLAKHHPCNCFTALSYEASKTPPAAVCNTCNKQMPLEKLFSCS
jgi:hypothetical protein